jgi:hypothetical protein
MYLQIQVGTTKMENPPHEPEYPELDATDALVQNYQRVMTIGRLIQDHEHGLYDAELQQKVDEVLPELMEIEEFESGQRIEFAVQQEREKQEQKLEYLNRVLCERYSGTITRLQAEEKQRAALMEVMIENACSQRERVSEIAAQRPELEFKEGPMAFEEAKMEHEYLMSEELRKIRKKMAIDYEKCRQKPQYVKTLADFEAQAAKTSTQIAKDVGYLKCDALRPLFQELLSVVHEEGTHPARKVANLQRVLEARLEVEPEEEVVEETESERSFVYAIVEGTVPETTEIQQIPCPETPIKVCRIRDFEPPPPEVEVEWADKAIEPSKEAENPTVASLILKQLTQIPLDDIDLVRQAIETTLETNPTTIPGASELNKHFIEAIDSLELIKCRRSTKSDAPCSVNNLICVSDSLDIMQKSFDTTSSSHNF